MAWRRQTRAVRFAWKETQRNGQSEGKGSPLLTKERPMTGVAYARLVPFRRRPRRWKYRRQLRLLFS
jgi:hypothetical protein